MRQNSKDSIEQSIAMYQRALAIDPGYAAAWSGLAATYNLQMSAGIIPFDEGHKLALEAANRALELDPNDAGALAELSFLSMTMDRDLAATARYLDRALELEPGNTEILSSAINLFRILGRLDKAIAVAEYSITLDPVNNSSYYLLGLMNRYSGNLDAAIEAFQTALQLSPGRIAAYYGISEALMLKGELEAALVATNQERGDSIWGSIALPMIYHAMGREADADAALAKLIEEEEMEAAYNIAYVYAYRGEVDRAFEWLDKAVEYNDPGLSDLPIESLFSNLHDDPRWLPFLESIGKSTAQLDSIEFDVVLPE